MRPHWRRSLRQAERNGLEIVEGSADALFGEFVGIFRELVSRKGFRPNNIREFRSIQKRLPGNLKMRILLCRRDGKLCSGLICSTVGDTAVYLFGATSNAGLSSKGSYLLHWRLIERLKDAGVTTYDLHGINPVKNPGTYKFKADLCGSNGQDVQFLGQFDSCTSVSSYACVALGDRLRQIVPILERGWRAVWGSSAVLPVANSLRRCRQRALGAFEAVMGRIGAARAGGPIDRLGIKHFWASLIALLGTLFLLWAVAAD
jgi:lipid II:glycine glycyltransferase (peptidoglycan interpeptide bridge formation enzyme)